MNLYDIAGKRTGLELTTTLLEAGDLRIERIVSAGETTGWYDQEEDEWLVLIEGEAELEFTDRTLLLRSGDTCLIPAHEKHKVNKTSADPHCIWLCVFFSPKKE